MMRVGFWYIYFLSFLCFTSSLFASVQAFLDRTEVALGESFVLSLSVEGGSPSIDISGFDFADVVGRSSSTQVSYVNGSFSKETTYSYQLVSTKEGVFEIPAITFDLNGKQVATKLLKITITAPSSQYKTQKNTGAEDFFEDEKEEESEENSQDLADIFITRKFSKKEIYVGESVLSTIKFYYAVKLQNLVPQFTRSDAFRYLDFKPTEEKEEYKGRLYNVVTLKTVLLPIKSGKHEMDRYRLTAEILKREERGRRSSFFDDFFGGGYSVENKSFATEKDTLVVKPIPEDGRPKNYRGLVGDFTLSAVLSDEDVKVGETSTLTITMKGQGSLDSYSEPDLNLPKHIKVYADKPELKEEMSPKTGLVSQKVFKFALVPTRGGNIDLGSYKESVFDTQKGKFVDLKAVLGTLKVEGSGEDETVSAASLNTLNEKELMKEQVKSLAHDLIDIKRGILVSSVKKKEGLSSYLLYLALALSFLYAGLRLFPYAFNPKSSDKKRKTLAYKNYKLKKQKINKEPSLEEIFSLFRGFLGDKFQLNASSLTKKELDQALGEVKLDEKTRTHVVEFFGSLEKAFFSQEGSKKDFVEKAFQEVDELVKKVDHYV